ncbi:MAG: Holliday junction resolvase RuvX [Ruminococcaceae bacterium]|nr:Holliday junction resolvase RuvX [Oscillospiraceae bacterium]
MGKIMGIDYGKSRIGLAVSDIMGLVANPLKTVSEKHFPSQVSAVAEEVKKIAPSKIVIGLPKNMDGTEGESAALAREFGEKLSAETGVPYEFLDERLTTVSAHKMLNEMNVNGSKKRRGVVDTLSAVIILQNYLDKEVHL